MQVHEGSSFGLTCFALGTTGTMYSAVAHTDAVVLEVTLESIQRV